MKNYGETMAIQLSCISLQTDVTIEYKPDYNPFVLKHQMWIVDVLTMNITNNWIKMINNYTLGIFVTYHLRIYFMSYENIIYKYKTDY